MVQPIPLGITFSKPFLKLKAQSSNVSFHWNVTKEGMVPCDFMVPTQLWQVFGFWFVMTPHGLWHNWQPNYRRHTYKWCVCCFVLLNRYWGIVTVPGSIPYGSRPGVAGSSPYTLTTSLAVPVPSSSSSNGSTTVPLITMGLCHGSSVAWSGPKFVRPHWWES